MIFVVIGTNRQAFQKLSAAYSRKSLNLQYRTEVNRMFQNQVLLEHWGIVSYVRNFLEGTAARTL